MMRKSMSLGVEYLVVATALTLAGCGDRDSAEDDDADDASGFEDDDDDDDYDEPPERSGVSPSSVLGSLTPDEQSELCGWAEEQWPAQTLLLCNDGSTVGDGVIMTRSICQDTIYAAVGTDCAATVANYENCIRPLECDRDLWSTACEAANACDPNGDVYTNSD